MRHRSVRTRIGSILLTGTMLLSLLPMSALATDQTQSPDTEQGESEQVLTGETSDTGNVTSPVEGTETEITPTKETEGVSENTASLETSIEETEFVVGKAIEFSFTTQGNYEGNVIGTSDFDNSEGAIEKLEYLEVNSEKEDDWRDLTGNQFGPSGGFPYGAGATSTFRVTFAEAGEYSFTAYILKATANVSEFTEEDVVCSATVEFTVEEAPVEDPVAVIGEQEYATLAEAVEDAASGSTIVMKAGTQIEGTQQVVIPAEKSLTLDLNGQEIKAHNNAAIKVLGHLTICDNSAEGNGKIVSTTKYGTVYTTGMVYANGEDASITMENGIIEAVFDSPASNGQYGVGLMNGADFTMTGGTIKAGWYAVSGNGTSVGDSTIDIEGGTLISTADYALYLPQPGTTNVIGGTIQGAAGGIAINRGTLNISGKDTVITNENTGDTGDWTDGTGSMGNATLNIAAKYDACTVNISGGTFTASKADTSDGAVLIETGTNNDVVLRITGGTFSDVTVDESGTKLQTYVPAGYTVQANETNSTWTVIQSENGGMEVTKPVTDSDGSVSSKLDGIYTDSDTEITTSGGDNTEQGVGENDEQGNLTIDLKVDTTGGETAPDKADLTVTKQAASTLNNANSLTVTADAGTVKLGAAALAKMSQSATDDVVISIEKGTGTDAGKYTFTATSDNKNLFPEGQGNVSITLTVPAPTGVTGGNVYVYYLGPNGAEKITNARIEGEEGSETVTWTVSHFSTYYVTATEQSVSVTVDGSTTTYTDFSNALAQIGADDIANVTLLGDVTLSKGADVSGKVKLDLNGHEITGPDSGSVYSEDYLLAVKRGGDLTINDTDGTGAITTDTIACAVKMTVTGEDNSTTPAKLTVNGGTIKGDWYGIVGNGTRHHTEITINNGTITNSSAGGTAIYHPQNGSLTITGGTIQSPNTAIEIRSGSLTVSGGTISGGTGEPKVSDNGNGTTTSNTGIAIAQHTTKKPITVTITGGTITGGAAVYESNPQDNDEATNGSNAVTVSIADADLKGDLKSSGFGDVSVNNTTINGNVDKAGTGNMGITDSTITGDVSKEESDSGSLGFVDSEIKGTSAPANDGLNGVTYVNTTVNGTVTNTTVTGKEAMVNGILYVKLEDAVAAAKDGDVVTLLGNVELDGSEKSNNEGILQITKSITLNGNGHTITAKDVTVTGTTDGPSMINITGNVNVTVRDLTIDGAGSDDATTDNTKHGLNIYGGAGVTVENVEIKNGNGYGIVANGSAVTVNGLTTSGNGWGGINVDSKSGKASLVVESATINEENSIKFENSSGGTDNDPSAEIKDGNFQYITKGDEITEKLDLTISGGKFAVGTRPNGAINVSQYLEAGLAIDSNGNVYTPSQGGSSSGGTTRYNVRVEDTDNGSIRVSPSRASRGQTVTITVDPDEGYVLDRLVVRDSDGDRIDLERKSATKYTFEMPRGAVTIEATFVEGEEENVLPFRDVDVDDWFYDAVVYAYENDLMSGVSDREFAPNNTLTRAMVAQMLWAMEGKPQVNYLMQYADVGSGDWYAEAVRWASSQGIMSGYGDSQFGPNDPVTRQQLALILYNYAREQGYDTDSNLTLSRYTDADSVAVWAVNALEWAVDAGLISGVGDNVLAPTGSATRAQVAQIFMNFLENVAK